MAEIFYNVFYKNKKKIKLEGRMLVSQLVYVLFKSSIKLGLAKKSYEF